MSVTDLPLSYVEIALHGKTPRVYLTENNTVATAKELQTTKSPVICVREPLYPDDKDITADTPFQYQMKSESITRNTYAVSNNKLLGQYREVITLTPHTQQSLQRYISDVRMVLSQDLVRKGIPCINFDPYVSYVFQQKTYVFHVEDLNIFKLLRYPKTVDYTIPDKSSEILHMAETPMFIPCMCNNEYYLFPAQHRAGKDLFQKYISVMKKYRDTLNMLLRTIEMWSFIGDQTPRALWVTLYGTEDQYGSIERVQL